MCAWHLEYVFITTFTGAWEKQVQIGQSLTFAHQLLERDVRTFYTLSETTSHLSTCILDLFAPNTGWPMEAQNVSFHGCFAAIKRLNASFLATKIFTSFSVFFLLLFQVSQTGGPSEMQLGKLSSVHYE